MVDFFFIGPDKAGSTWLYGALCAHQKVFIPLAKDIYYFDRYYDRGVTWYESKYSKKEEGQIAGDISHDYLFCNESPGRILSYNSNAKIITILRDPASRSFSQYLNYVRSGELSPKVSFREAVSIYPNIISNSQYHKHLPHYQDLFPEHQMGIFLFDDLLSNAQTFANSIYDFLGIDSIDISKLDIYERQGAKPRFRLLSRIAKETARGMRAAGLEDCLGFIKNSKINSVLYRSYSKDEKPSLSNEDREWINDVFQQDVEFVRRITGRELLGWR